MDNGTSEGVDPRLICPTCGSHAPDLHPATSRGEVTALCDDEFHRTSFWQKLPVVRYDPAKVNFLLRWPTSVPPTGCRWCGIERREHGQLWIRGRGFHVYTEPTRAQNAARLQVHLRVMREAREARDALLWRMGEQR